MTDYVPTGKPDDGTRYDARAIRREFNLIAAGISSKSDLNSDSTVSTTSMLIESPATKTFTAETGKDFAPGQTVYMADAANPAANNMTGVLTSYAKDTTGIMIVSVTSHNGSGTKSDWAIGVSNQSGVTLGANTFTGAQNFARATVASHATTADIWGAAGNQIDFTGIATVTDFPDAPQAGATRTLICAAGCSFTASANMIIAGLASGETVVCVTNDKIIVEAVALDQFHLHRIRYDGFPALAPKGGSVFYGHTGNGHGSSSTMKRRLTTVVTNTGQSVDWTYTDSATLGGKMTFLRPGVYCITYADIGSKQYGLSKNQASAGTTVFDSLTAAEKFLRVAGESGNEFNCASITSFMTAGEFIEMITNGATWTTNANAWTALRVERLF